jgi:hypothetical protein
VVVALDLAVDRLHLDVVAGLHPEQRQLAAVGAERERERERLGTYFRPLPSR